MVEAILAGELDAGVPLFDLLAETDDVRRFDLLRYLSDLRESYLERSEVAGSRRFSSQEEKAYRLSEVKFEAWQGFSRSIGSLFFYELRGMPDLSFLTTLSAELDSAAQAARLRRETEDAEAVEDGEAPGMGMSSPYVPKSMKRRR